MMLDALEAAELRMVSAFSAGKPPSLAQAGQMKVQGTELRQRMTEIVRQAPLAQTSAEIVFDEGYPPLAPTDGNRKLLAIYDRASRDVGAGPVAAVDPDRAGAADISFVAGLVPRVLDGIGLMGDGGHTVKETADLRTLPTQAKRAALLMYRVALNKDK